MILSLNRILCYSFSVGVPILYMSAKYFDFYTESFLGFFNFENFLYHLSWGALLFVMGIKPLSGIMMFFHKSIGKKITKLLIFRQSFGILTSLIILTILLGKFILQESYITSYFSLDSWNLLYPLLGRIGEFTGLILLITSNNFSKKFLKKNWKKIQRSSYIYFISGGLVAAQWDSFYYWSMGVIALLYIVHLVLLKLKK